MRNKKYNRNSSYNVNKVDPCVDCCNRKICTNEKVACLSMRIWVMSNRIDLTKRNSPTREFYDQIYGARYD